MPQRPLATQLLVTTPIRVVLNTAYRMTYPFLPTFSRGLGVDEATLTALLSVRNGLGLSAPLLGMVPDRFGRRFSMLLGLAIFIATCGVAALWPSLWTFGLAVLGIGVAKLLHDPALLAHLGDQTPYAQRGRVMGISEFGWSGATFIGIPLLGRLIGRFGWAAPFAPLAVLGVLAVVGVRWVIHSATTFTPVSGAIPSPTRRGEMRALLKPHLLAAISMGALAALANEILNVSYGRWMEQSFSLQVAQLGATTIVIGAAELLGEGTVATLADRVGKRRMVLGATALSAAAYLLLPALTASLPLALSGVFLVFLCFETMIVSTIPLVSELIPEARSTVISSTVTLQSIGRMSGALAGGALMSLGFAWAMGVAAALNGVVLLLVWGLVREHAAPTDAQPING